MRIARSRHPKCRHGVHRHGARAPRRHTRPGPALVAPPAHVRDAGNGKHDHDEGIEGDEGEHSGQVRPNLVERVREIVGDRHACGARCVARDVRGIVGDVLIGRAASHLVEIDGGLVRIDEGKKLDVWVTHVARRIIVAEVVDSVDRPQDIVPDEPIAATIVGQTQERVISEVITYNWPSPTDTD